MRPPDTLSLAGSSENAVGPYVRGPSWILRLLRSTLFVAAAWAFLGLVMTAASVFALLTFRIGSDRYFYRVVRLCGRTILALQGVRLRVIHRERISEPKARIIATNHTSQLDMFVFAAILPPRGTGIVKKEFLYIPFINLLLLAFGVLRIDRRNSRKAKASLTKAARMLRERQATVVMAPEGTRSPDGTLQPFKMGLFHLALESRAPIQPAVIRGAAACLPLGAVVARPGVVEVELLPEMATEDFTRANLTRKRDELRARFVARLRGAGEANLPPRPRRASAPA